MSSPHSSQSRDRIPLYLSLATHCLVALVLVPLGLRITPRMTPAEQYQIAMVEVAGGSAMAKSPLLVAPSTDKKADEHPPEPRESGKAAPQKRHVPKPSGSEAKAARAQDLGSSSTTGNGSDMQDATPAFPTFSPKPPVTDRSLLPRSDRQIIVDVKLSADGEVLSENLAVSMGNALDQIVLDTVKTWRFQPATVNGRPIPSEAEVIFTFNQKYPTAGA